MNDIHVSLLLICSPAGSAVVAAVLEAELEISVTSAFEYVPY